MPARLHLVCNDIVLIETAYDMVTQIPTNRK
jgi:hypothetical protein